MIGATLAAVMMSSALLQFALGVLAPFLVTDLGLSRTELGMLNAVLFASAAGLSRPVGGVVDLVGARRLCLLVVGLSGSALLGVAAAPGFATLTVAVAVAGLPMAAANPATNVMVYRHVPPGRRGLVMGVKQSGVQAGSFVVGLVVPALAAQVGWRGALTVVALLGGATYAAGWVALPRDRSGPARGGRARGRSSPIVRRLALYALLMGVGMAAVTAYLPLYGFERVGMSAAGGGALVAVAGLVGVVARLVWGHLSDRASTVSNALVALACVAVAAQALIYSAESAGAATLWLGAVAFGASASAWNALALLAVLRGVEAHLVGHGSGVVVFAFFAGLAVGPPMAGWLIDVTGSYGPAWATVAGLQAAAVGTAWWARREELARSGASGRSA